jgi:hypothetical protein
MEMDAPLPQVWHYQTDHWFLSAYFSLFKTWNSVSSSQGMGKRNMELPAGVKIYPQDCYGNWEGLVTILKIAYEALIRAGWACYACWSHLFYGSKPLTNLGNCGPIPLISKISADDKQTPHSHHTLFTSLTSHPLQPASREVGLSEMKWKMWHMV